MFAFVMRLYKVWWLCLPLSSGCTRYGGCVCLCRAVVQGMMAVFAFVMRLYKYGGCVCLCRAVVPGMVAVFAFANTVRWPLYRSRSGNSLCDSKNCLMNISGL